MAFQANVNLKPYNTLQVEVIASRCLVVDSTEQLVDVINQRSVEIALILGSGSNVVLTKDIHGLVIVNRIKGIVQTGQIDDLIELKVGAGENWDDFVQFCVENDYWGVENLAAIPGCVGACPIQNIGAYGVEVESVISRIEVVRRSDGRVLFLTREQCQFSYRHSLFKSAWKDQFVITAVVFQLSKQGRPQLGYGELADRFRGFDINAISARDIYSAVKQIRAQKLPEVSVSPNVGSFFKNPVIEEQRWHRLRASYPEIVGYPQDGGLVKVAAGWLIDKAGWKGYTKNGVQVHQKQALVLINQNPKADALLDLAARLKKDIYDKFGIELEIEPALV